MPLHENIIGTNCCALVQVTASDQYSTISVLRTRIKEVTKAGYRAIFVITLPHETKLVQRLLKLGFGTIANFNRRRGYPQFPLTMWLKQL